MTTITKTTLADLEAVAGFFAIDLETNRHIFRHAATLNGPAFEATIRTLAEACRQDIRHGTSARIRATIAEAKAREQAAKAVQTKRGPRV